MTKDASEEKFAVADYYIRRIQLMRTGSSSDPTKDEVLKMIQRMTEVILSIPEEEFGHR